MRRGDTELAVGSGLLYRSEGEYYIVTAWHNVTGRHCETLKCLDEKTLACPDNVVAYMSCMMKDKTGPQGFVRFPFVIPLYDEEKALYFVHEKQWPRVDVVAIPIFPDEFYEVEWYGQDGSKHVASKQMRNDIPSIGCGSDIVPIQGIETRFDKLREGGNDVLNVGDELFILGYPMGLIDDSGQPIWKRATVATSPWVGWNREKKFLVDCASREGMSGAPALYYNKSGEIRAGASTYIVGRSVTLFWGIYTSRVGKTSEFEAQIGTVWRREVVDEIIRSKISPPASEGIEVAPSIVRDTISNMWPTDEDYPDMVKKSPHIAWHLTQLVMQKIEGRANPNDVHKLIISKAEEMCGNFIAID